MKHAQAIKGLEWAEILATILRGGYMAKEGAFQARKWCGPKPLHTAPISRAHIILYPIVTSGFPLVVQLCSNPKEDSVNEKGLVAETSAQSINRKHGNYG
jgi:hypothetical protein